MTLYLAYHLTRQTICGLGFSWFLIGSTDSAINFSGSADLHTPSHPTPFTSHSWVLVAHQETPGIGIYQSQHQDLLTVFWEVPSHNGGSAFAVVSVRRGGRGNNGAFAPWERGWLTWGLFMGRLTGEKLYTPVILHSSSWGTYSISFISHLGVPNSAQSTL